MKYDVFQHKSSILWQQLKVSEYNAVQLWSKKLKCYYFRHCDVCKMTYKIFSIAWKYRLSKDMNFPWGNKVNIKRLRRWCLMLVMTACFCCCCIFYYVLIVLSFFCITWYHLSDTFHHFLCFFKPSYATWKLLIQSMWKKCNGCFSETMSINKEISLKVQRPLSRHQSCLHIDMILTFFLMIQVFEPSC